MLFPSDSHPMAIRWHAWDDGTLERAAREKRPILLSIVASWCRFCDEMDEVTFSDAEVTRLVEQHALPVRVDKDARPDLDARYGQGGWPSTVLLDPGTRQVIAGGTFLDAGALSVLVCDAARRCATVGPEREAQARAGEQPSGRLDETILPAVEQALRSAFDERHGGFGRGQKFPHPEALDFALLRYADTGAPALLEIIERTLCRMAEGRLRDHVDGGFYRFCAGRDWTHPHTEKLLEANAGLLRNYLEAGQLLQRGAFLDVAGELLATLLRDFHDPREGLFSSSLEPDDEYYRLDAQTRATRRRPAPDGRFLADANARAASALFKAGAVLDRPDATDCALLTCETLVERLWSPSQGVFHALEPGGRRMPGLLRDQAEIARTLLHALQYTDERALLDPLEDLLARLVRDHVGERGMLTDRQDVAHAVPRRVDREILEGAIAAEALIRGALLVGRPEYAEAGRRALAAHAPRFRRQGYAMAAYGRAVELALHPPLHILVVGAADDARTRALFAAASRAYLPSRVVQRLDPVRDAARIERLALPPSSEPVVHVHHAHDCATVHADARDLVEVLLRAARRRV